MIYIEKEGLADDLNQEIISIRKSDAWKKIPEDHVGAIRNVFDHMFPKNDVKAVLIREQRGLCAYCMRRIRMDTSTRVEHFVPLSVDKEKAIDYYNMLGVCDGGEKCKGEQGHILCCDAHKGENKIHINPLNRVQMDKISYKPDGIIFTQPRDERMEQDINETLRLNGVRKKDGSFRDTSTEILKGRRDAYDRARGMMEKLGRSGKCTSAAVKKLMDALWDKEEREEFVGVKLYYFRKKYHSLVRRGM